MERTRFDRLVEVMALLAGGDRAALFMLYDEFGDQIAVAVRHELRRVNAAVSSDDFGGLVIDATMAIAACAPGWDPARGALPWVWAAHRVRNVVASHVGQFADSLDEPESKALRAYERAAAAGPSLQPAESASEWRTETDVLARLAASEEVCKLLLAALAEVTTPRDREILLAYKVQSTLGDPSPANTVGVAFGLKPATVRQVVKRGIDRLRRLAAADARFDALSDLRLLT